ncbi:uncharacterized protein LOC143348465 [Colletes latitarsis]|uniref:uncharacterized protein LOC143348465 n=1 Tax=Colletes latitarsis TaxID=2605962 RepID=UPI0040375EE5
MSQFCTGLTPLHKAAFLGHTNALEKLLENGATIDCTDSLGRSPLHYATLQENIGSATVLLTNNANINVYDVFDECPLYTCILRRRSYSMIKLLLSFGATVSSAPHKSSLGLLLEIVLSARSISDLYILDLLFQNGADLNTTDIGLRTPLHIAAMTGNLMLALYLVEEGADLHRKNRNGYTPLEVAMAYKNSEIIELIEYSLSKKLQINSTSSTTNLINE